MIKKMPPAPIAQPNAKRSHTLSMQAQSDDNNMLTKNSTCSSSGVGVGQGSTCSPKDVQVPVETMSGMMHDQKNHNIQQQQQQQQQIQNSNSTSNNKSNNNAVQMTEQSSSRSHHTSTCSKNTANTGTTCSTTTSSGTGTGTGNSSRTTSRASTPSTCSIGSCASHASAPPSPSPSPSSSQQTHIQTQTQTQTTASSKTTNTTEAAAATTTTTTSSSLASALSLSSRRRNVQVSAASLLPPYLSGFVQHSHEDFFISPFFDPQLIAQLMCEGFLPISTSRYLLPKLHKERCVIYPLQQQHQQQNQNQNQSTVHTSKSTKKKLKRFTFSINQDFDGVVAGCHEQHGVAWLYPKIVSSFRYIHERTKVSKVSKTLQRQEEDGHETLTQNQKQEQEHGTDANTDTNTENDSNTDIAQGRGVVASLIENDRSDATSVCDVKLYSIEVWNQQTGKLAGGELGYTIGTIYTSLTGFSCEDSAGSVQLATLGKILCLSGYEMWDLGMGLDYKTNLGAKAMERIDFVDLVKDMRVRSPFQSRTRTSISGVELICEEKMNCKDIYDMNEW
eukprot:CAMPEP_0203721176 /NCGR_PEP_ID=MMETSP0092-20131115/4714_1 /ASSEMBLY_ACC=CAM_ASM_001090 /TAXON_ID=426623 /ORGANISM="Chaetoceros affinis, Strain CCMP159" /LENGTH=560 /DNA_ID=CAMNT_0050601009 /DNA_START=155 /DNA_END=1834 /DNA_ORIENTATION=-